MDLVTANKQAQFMLSALEQPAGGQGAARATGAEEGLMGYRANKRGKLSEDD